jgi:hypothetical protein
MGGGGSGPHLGSEWCVVNLHGYDRHSNSAHRSCYSALGPVMTDDPWSAYGAWIIQCDTTQVMVMNLFRGCSIRAPSNQPVASGRWSVHT